MPGTVCKNILSLGTASGVSHPEVKDKVQRRHLVFLRSFSLSRSIQELTISPLNVQFNNSGYPNTINFLRFFFSFCKNNTLDASLIKGKIVICNVEALTDSRQEKLAVVTEAGAVGIIVVFEAFKDIGIQFPIPGAIVGQDEGILLQQYVDAEKYCPGPCISF